jgi:hypothetical protein
VTSDHVLQKTVKTKAQHRRRFRRRFARALGFSSLLIGAALFLGVLGYHFVARFGWIDSVLNASMILTGMGPVGQLETNAAKLFASAYALLSGLVFVTAMGIVLSPMIHRVLLCFHLEEKEELL